MTTPKYKRNTDGTKTIETLVELSDLNSVESALDTRLTNIENQLPDDDTALLNAIAANAAAIAAEMSATDGDVASLMALILGNTQATNANATGLANLISSLPDFATFAAQVDLDTLETATNNAIATINTQLTANATAISSNASDISNNDTRITALENATPPEELSDTFILGAGGVNADTIISFLPNNVARNFVATANGSLNFGPSTTTIINGVQNSPATSPLSVPLGATGYLYKNGAGNTVIVYQTISQSAGSTRSLATAEVTIGQDVNDNDVIDLDTPVLDPQWSFNNSEITYAGTPSDVMLTGQANFSSGSQRVAPLMNIEKFIGGSWQQMKTGATGYIRGQSGHNQASITVFYRDRNPGANPSYRLSSGREANFGATTVIAGQFDAEATTNA